MPAVPKKKSTRGRTGRRRGDFKVSLPHLATCPSCKKTKLAHRACAHCGYWHKSAQ